MTPLAQLQSRFKKALLSTRRPSGPALRELGIRVSPEFSLSERIGVYHADYFLRISDSLAEDFPILCEHLGPEEFDRLIRDYLAHYPSRYSSLAQIGQDLPAYIDECKKFMHQPWIRQLAELEWKRCLAIWTETSETTDFQKLSQLSEEEQAIQRLTLQPSLQFFEATHRVHQKDFTELGETRLAIYALHGNLKELEITEDQEKLLRQIQTGESFEALTEWLGGQPNLSPHAAGWFSKWVAAGLLTGFQPV